MITSPMLARQIIALSFVSEKLTPFPRYSYGLFCIPENSTLIKSATSKLFSQNTRGMGYLCDISAYSAPQRYLCFHNLTNPFSRPASSSGLRKYRHIASGSQRGTKANAKRTQPCVPFNALYRHSMHRNTIQRKVWSHKANSGRLDVGSLWGLRAVIQSVGTSAACGAAQSHERY
jgi:hypothetical protein